MQLLLPFPVLNHYYSQGKDSVRRTSPWHEAKLFIPDSHDSPQSRLHHSFCKYSSHDLLIFVGAAFNVDLFLKYRDSGTLPPLLRHPLALQDPVERLGQLCHRHLR